MQFVPSVMDMPLNWFVTALIHHHFAAPHRLPRPAKRRRVSWVPANRAFRWTLLDWTTIIMRAALAQPRHQRICLTTGRATICSTTTIITTGSAPEVPRTTSRSAVWRRCARWSSRRAVRSPPPTIPMSSKSLANAAVVAKPMNHRMTCWTRKRIRWANLKTMTRYGIATARMAMPVVPVVVEASPPPQWFCDASTLHHHRFWCPEHRGVTPWTTTIHRNPLCILEKCCPSTIMPWRARNVDSYRWSCVRNHSSHFWVLRLLPQISYTTLWSCHRPAVPRCTAVWVILVASRSCAPSPTRRRCCSRSAKWAGDSIILKLSIWWVSRIESKNNSRADWLNFWIGIT